MFGMFRLAEQKYSKVSSIPSKRRVSCAFIPRFYHRSFFSARTGEDAFAIGLQVGSGRVCVCQTIFLCRKRTLGLWVAACRDRTTAATLSQRSLVNVLAVSQEHSETSHRAFDVLHRVVAKHFDVDIRLLETPSVSAKSLLRKWRSYLR